MKKLQIEALLFFAIGIAVGFVAIQTQNSNPVTITSKAAEPTPFPTTVPTTTTTSQISSDGTKQVILHMTENSDGTKIYDVSTTDHKDVIFAKLLPLGGTMSIPFNTFSANNSYFFIQENTASETNIYVFRTNGEPFANGETAIDVTKLFQNSPRRSNGDTFYEATGWAESNLLIINTKKPDKTQGASYWVEIPSMSVIRLAHQF